MKFLPVIEKLVALNTWWRAREIHKMIAPRGRVLEIGCGRGWLLKDLAEWGHECFGTERSELAAQRARKTVGLRVYTTPLEECGFEPNYFDLIILWHVLEHLERPRECLNYTKQLLKPGGILLLEVPNFSSLQAQYAGKFWFHLDVERHLYHFSLEGLIELLRKTGFSVVRQGTFSWEQGPYGVLQSLLNCWGFPAERLYQLLKQEIKLPRHKALLQFLLAGLLAPPAFTFSILESLAGRGGVIRIVAKRQHSRN